MAGLSKPTDAAWPELRRALADVDPTVPMFGALSAADGIRAEFAEDALLMRVAIAFGVLAALVAAAGLMSALTRSVVERAREMGIRAALGATPREIAALVTREAIAALAAGVVLGGALAAWLTRFIGTWIFGISRLDAVSFAAAIAFVVVIMLGSTAPVCRRAMRLNPIDTLKE